MTAQNTDPLGIFFLSSGTRGDKLLFRYPCTSPVSATDESQLITDNPYAIRALNVSEEYDVERVRMKHRNCQGRAGPLSSYPDLVLANLLGIRSKFASRKLQLKVNDILFVGFPVQMSCRSSAGTPSTNKDSSTTASFNTVFALNASIDVDVIQYYLNLAKQIGIALIHEEQRCGYLTQQKKIMWEIQDYHNTLPEASTDSMFSQILRKSSLAKQLKQMYDSLCDGGSLRLYINKWVHISFCLPPKVHSVLSSDVNQHVFVNVLVTCTGGKMTELDVWSEHKNRKLKTKEPNVVRKCVEALRPYHTFLLLESEEKLISSLPIDSSPALIRLVRVASPLKNLHILSADADLSIQQVLQLVSHLVYWGKATVIYPLCESNVYLMSPNSNTHISTLEDSFNNEFPELKMSSILALFSVPCVLREQRETITSVNPQYLQAQFVPVVIWLLQHRILYQVHTYITLLPPSVCERTSDISDDCSSSELSSSIEVLSVTGDTGSFNGIESCVPQSTVDSSLGSSITHRRQSTLQLLSNLSPAEIRAVFDTASASSEDIKLFARLCHYFDGYHHFEEIMFYENMKRSQLVLLLDKFHSVLVLCQHEEPDISYWINS